MGVCLVGKRVLTTLPVNVPDSSCTPLQSYILGTVIIAPKLVIGKYNSTVSW